MYVERHEALKSKYDKDKAAYDAKNGIMPDEKKDGKSKRTTKKVRVPLPYHFIMSLTFSDSQLPPRKTHLVLLGLNVLLPTTRAQCLLQTRKRMSPNQKKLR